MPDKDTLTLTIRIHDPAEKKDAKKSSAWAVIDVPREDFKIASAAFIKKHIAPHLAAMRKQMELGG